MGLTLNIARKEDKPWGSRSEDGKARFGLGRHIPGNWGGWGGGAKHGDLLRALASLGCLVCLGDANNIGNYAGRLKDTHPLSTIPLLLDGSF